MRKSTACYILAVKDIILATVCAAIQQPYLTILWAVTMAGWFYLGNRYYGQGE